MKVTKEFHIELAGIPHNSVVFEGIRIDLWVCRMRVCINQLHKSTNHNLSQNCSSVACPAQSHATILE